MSSNEQLYAQSMTELAAGLERGDFTSVELTEALLARIGKLGPGLNAFITVTADGCCQCRQSKSGRQRRRPQRAADRPQGYFLHARHQDDLWFANARQLYFTVRRDGCGKTR